MSVGVAFIQNNGWVLLKSGLSTDVNVIGIHHRVDPSPSGGDAVVLFSVLWRKRKRSYSKH